MKILFVITELGPGGAERVVLNLASGLISRGHCVVVVSLCPPPSVSTIPDALSRAGVTLVWLDGARSFPRLVRSLRAVLLDEQPDLVHSHLMHSNLVARFALFHSRIPLVNTIHIAERRSGQFLLFLLDRLSFSRASAVTAVSRAAAEWHAARIHLSSNSIRVIYNGSDPVSPASPELLDSMRREWNLADCSRIIGSIGRFVPQKGFDLLLSRLAPLAERVPPGETWAVLLLGDGPERPALEALAESARFPNLRIVMPGYFPDAASRMALFDVFLMPSRYEGYGLALAEAFSLGLPVVCARIDSLPELCALYHGPSWLVDFSADENGVDLAGKLAAAAASPRVLPQILMSNADMTAAYLALYQSL